MPSGRDRKLAVHYLSRGKQLGFDQQYRDALEALQAAVRLDPTSVTAWVTLALTHYRLREYNECLGAVDEALKYDSASGAAWKFRGLALTSLHRDEEALDAFAHMMRIDGWYVAGARNAFDTLTNAERFDEALRVADVLLAEQRNNGHFWTMRSAALRLLQQYEQAYHAATEAVRLGPTNGYAWFQLAAALCELKRYNEALNAWERESELRGVSSSSWWLKSLIFSGQRRFEEALAASQEALALEPELRYVLNQAGIALLNLGRPAEAYQQFIQAAALKPRKPNYPSNAGVALHRLHRYEDALTWTDRALTLQGDFAAAVINRADDLVHLGRFEEAEAQLADARETFTEHSDYWAVKGLLHTRRGEYDEALTAIKQAIDLSDDDDNTAVAYERMGELLIALEDCTKALEFAEHGVELRPHDFCLQELKAKALRGLGRESEADEIERSVQARLAEQLALLDQAESADE